ncbi:hypothetical protein VV01_06290 [Luteipulveratus halotolerans]|uniref:Htaa domain-containing protein n=2 Tax=Luteipulveratus halotolerans TaxID=1631356 RepID=A0A0L6CNE7_9MICO|nr:hypothetical protein VV01_06290 [Luteipulveratus halotolerans]
MHSNASRRAGGALAVGAVAALALTGAAVAQPSATATDRTTVQRAEGHVTGDAWVKFSVDPQNPLRRFTFDAHGNPYKVADGRIVFGDARGSVSIDHPEPKPDGTVVHHRATVKVDYVMATGPVAVVSGLIDSGSDLPIGERASFTVYDDPRSTRHDRMGFSWGVVDGQCHRAGKAPAPFTSYASGPGYTVKDAPLPRVPAGAEPQVEPGPCPAP